MKNKQLLYDVSGVENLDYAKDLVKRFLLLNESFAGRGRFDLFKYVSKDASRPALCGVFHDNGKMVATTSHILIAINREYDSNMEGKIINKNGEEVNAEFPRWESVIPREPGSPIQLPVFEKYNEIIRRYKLMKKEGAFGRKNKWNGNYEKNPVFKICDDTFMAADNFILFYEACVELGTMNMETYGRYRCIKASSDKGVAIIMPVVIDDEKQDNVYVIND